MRLPRFRIRTLMIAVAAVGVLMGGWLEYERTKPWRRYCRNQADLLGFLVEYDAYWSHSEHFEQFRAEGASAALIARLRRDYERFHPHAQSFAKLRRKWLFGAWIPWTDVEPDPPGVPQFDLNFRSPWRTILQDRRN